MTTPTKNPKPAAPCVIEGPGEYVTRDGRTVEVFRSPWPDNPGCAWCDEFNQLYGPTGAQYRARHPHPRDIIARAPSPKPAPASKVRRYEARQCIPTGGLWWVMDTVRYRSMATGLSRADARAFAALKNATTTPKRPRANDLQ